MNPAVFPKLSVRLLPCSSKYCDLWYQITKMTLDTRSNTRSQLTDQWVTSTLFLLWNQRYYFAAHTAYHAVCRREYKIKAELISSWLQFFPVVLFSSTVPTFKYKQEPESIITLFLVKQVGFQFGFGPCCQNIISVTYCHVVLYIYADMQCFWVWSCLAVICNSQVGSQLNTHIHSLFLHVWCKWMKMKLPLKMLPSPPDKTNDCCDIQSMLLCMIVLKNQNKNHKISVVLFIIQYV